MKLCAAPLNGEPFACLGPSAAPGNRGTANGTYPSRLRAGTPAGSPAGGLTSASYPAAEAGKQLADGIQGTALGVVQGQGRQVGRELAEWS
jgi:hypothetical protein